MRVSTRTLMWLVVLFLGQNCILSAADADAIRDPREPQLNFVLFIADDMNWDDCGAYGHPKIRTPNIDRLANQGMRFDNAFMTISSCSPSRASIITGRYPHATDAEQLHWPLPSEQVTFAEKLRAAGYWCGAAGKWHLGESAKKHFHVVKEADPSGFQLPTGPDGKPGAMVAADPSGCRDWLPLVKERPQDRPFLLWLAALDPHRDYQRDIIEKPHRAEDVRVPPYLPDAPEVRDELALYYDEVTRLDGFVGRVLDELDKQGVSDSTFVLFLSDNGRPFPREKTSIYDSGIKTPWIVRFPGLVAPGVATDSLVSAVDIAPTILELARLEPLKTAQGVSFAPILKERAANVRSLAFAEDNWHDYEDLSRAVRSKQFKYIRNFYSELPATPPADVNRSVTMQTMRRMRDTGRLTPVQQACFAKPRPCEELYDVRVDPHEIRNLVSDPDYSDILSQMRGALAEWQEQTKDVLPEKRTPDEFDRETGQPLPNRIRPRPSKREMFGDTPR
jgi:N-sulfoglucosamine sulfohydrolase